MKGFQIIWGLRRKLSHYICIWTVVERQDFGASEGSQLCEEEICGMKIDRMGKPSTVLFTEVQETKLVIFLLTLHSINALIKHCC